MLTSLLERQAVERPRHPAVVCAGKVISWRKLEERVRHMAAGLAFQGIMPGERVALVLRNNDTFVSSLLAVARRGAVAVPCSWEWKDAELLSALETTQCQTVLADASRETFIQTCRRSRPDCRFFLTSGQDQDSCRLNDLEEAPTSQRVATPDGDADALELFTSGSTGHPKRVIRKHAHLLNLGTAYAQTVGVDSRDRIWTVIPLTHGHGLCSSLLASLQTGATMFLQARFDRRETLRQLSRQRITVFPAVPFIYSILADTRTHELIDLSALRLCITGGSPLTSDVWRKVDQRLGIKLRQSYGSSETGAACVNMDTDAGASADSVGRPLAGVEVSVRDESGHALPSGVRGEVYVRSPAAAEWSIVASRDDARYEPVRLADPTGWIRMGDVGSLDSAMRLTIFSRQGRLVNVAGKKVQLEEVERVLLSHPFVERATLSTTQDRFGEQLIHATVYAHESCSRDHLLAHCREQLADYKIPRGITLLPADRI